MDLSELLLWISVATLAVLLALLLVQGNHKNKCCDWCSNEANTRRNVSERVDLIERQIATKKSDTCCNWCDTAAISLAGRLDTIEAQRADVPTDFLVNGKVAVKYLPALAITSVTVFPDMASFLNPTGYDEGDVAIVADTGDGHRESFIYNGEVWLPLSSPTDVTEEELAAAVSAGLGRVNQRLEALERNQ